MNKRIKTNKLAIGSALTTSRHRRKCRVGLFVRDNTSVYLLTARHILAGDDEILQTEAGITVGAIALQSLEQAGPRPFYAAIAGIRLNKKFADTVARDTVSERPCRVAHLQSMLGTSVDIFGRRASNGRILATHRVFAMRNKFDGTIASYHDTIEVRFDSRDAVGKGDGGSLVVASNGDAVGLVIARRDESCFVAPIQPFLAAYGVTLLASTRHPADLSKKVGALRAALEEEESLNFGVMPRIRKAA